VRMTRLCGLVLEVGDEIVAVLGLLQATEGHLGAGNVLLGVLEVLEESVITPGDALALVGVGVSVSGDLAGLSAPKSVKVGSDLVALTLLEVVALSATGLEEVGALLGVTRCEAVLAHFDGYVICVERLKVCKRL